MRDSIFFNHVYVIQSLPDEELQTGKHLHNDIIKRWAGYVSDHLHTSFISIDNKLELFLVFESLPSAFEKEQVIPYLHFEVHGCKSGIKLKDGTLVHWEEFRRVLQQINVVIEDNLIVSLATCFGAYIFQTVDPLDRSPFYGFVGPANEIVVKELEIDWINYFTTLFQTRNVHESVVALNSQNPKLKYAFLTAEQIFDKMMNQVLEDQKYRRQRRERRARLIKKALSNPSTRQYYTRRQIEDYFTKIVFSQKQMNEYWKEYFLYKTDKLPLERMF